MNKYYWLILIFLTSCKIPFKKVNYQIVKENSDNDISAISLDSFMQINRDFCRRIENIDSVKFDSSLYKDFTLIKNTFWEYNCTGDFKNTCLDSSLPMCNFLSSYLSNQIRKADKLPVYIKEIDVYYPSYGNKNSYFQILGLKSCRDSINNKQ